MSTFQDLPVVRATFTATVTFEAYVATDSEGYIDLSRVAWEIADAIEFRAPHLSDSEGNDAIVALVGGGSGEAVDVSMQLVSHADDVTEAAVASAVESTEAWL